jgi:AcrR family transcriptional regulator
MAERGRTTPTRAPTKASIARSPEPAPAPQRSTLASRTIDRTVADRYAAAASEVDGIIEATYRVIERAGSVDPRMREILAEAGVSTQVFYRHFQSKNELMLVLLDDGRRRLATYLEHQMEKAGDPLQQVRAWIEGTLEQVRDTGAAARTRPFARSLGQLQEQYPEEHRESVEVLVQLLRTAIDAAVEAGQVTVADAGDSAMLIYLMTHGLMDRHLREVTTPTDAEVERCVQFALRGIGGP